MNVLYAIWTIVELVVAIFLAVAMIEKTIYEIKHGGEEETYGSGIAEELGIKPLF